jgi:hypothetical protein
MIPIGNIPPNPAGITITVDTFGRPESPAKLPAMTVPCDMLCPASPV